MILVLDIRTSLEFWRRAYPGDHAPKGAVALPTAKIAEAQKDIRALAPRWLSSDFMEPYGGVIHVYTQGPSGAHSSELHRTHRLPVGIPDNSFYALNSGAYIASPELIFLEAARLLDTAQLIALGDELCDTYGFDESSPRGFRNRQAPLATIESIRAYLDRGMGCHGLRRAISALAHVVEASASPRETHCEMLLCLPYRLGGYSIVRPVMNYEIPLSHAAARIAGRDKCYGDLCWPKQGLIVEYLGEYDHGTVSRSMSDRARTNGLKMMGYDVIELTSNQLNDLSGFETTALFIAKRTGHRIKSQDHGNTPERLVLRRALAQWSANYGVIGP